MVTGCSTSTKQEVSVPKVPSLIEQVKHMLVAITITCVYILICAVHSVDTRSVQSTYYERVSK